MDASLAKVEVAAFDAARLRAIDQYALLEARLAWLLSIVLGVDIGKANVVFYRVVNARSRMGIISDLLAKSPFAETKPYWRSVEKAVIRIDGLRNRIIHYVSVYDHGTTGGTTPGTPKRTLLPGADFSTESQLTLEDLQSFKADVQTLATEIMYYAIFLRGDEKGSDHAPALLEIFRRPRDGQSRLALEKVLFPTAPPPPPQLSQA